MDCPQFDQIKGNMKEYMLEVEEKKKSIRQSKALRKHLT
jgi:hypothetical protein